MAKAPLNFKETGQSHNCNNNQKQSARIYRACKSEKWQEPRFIYFFLSSVGRFFFASLVVYCFSAHTSKVISYVSLCLNKIQVVCIKCFMIFSPRPHTLSLSLHTLFLHSWKITLKASPHTHSTLYNMLATEIFPRELRKVNMLAFFCALYY